jgi:hypothetical protein
LEDIALKKLYTEHKWIRSFRKIDNPNKIENIL